jgi:uncharacterized protein
MEDRMRRSQVIHDQTKLGEPESQDVVYERYKTQL